MHAKPDLRVFLKWMITRSGSVITDVIRLNQTMRLPAIAIASLIAFVTLVANTGAGSSLLGFVQLLPGKDLAGHFGLYGALGLALSLCLKGALKHDVTLIGLVTTAIIAEEFSQMFIGHRTFSLTDLAASLTGFAFGVCAIRGFLATYMIREWLLGFLINQAVPALNLFRKGLPWNTKFDELENFPDQSWGRETHTFLANRNLCFLPKYEHHDTLHVLLNYDTTVMGEARLQSFMVGNQTPTFAGRGLYILALVMMPEHWRTFSGDRRRGVESKAINWMAVENALSLPLSDVRREWNIQTKAHTVG